MSSSLQAEKVWRMRLDTSYENDCTAKHTYIDHMSFDAASNTMFGTTRSNESGLEGTRMYIWRALVTGTNEIDTTPGAFEVK